MDMNKIPTFVVNDPYLRPYLKEIQERYTRLQKTKENLSITSSCSLSDFACGHLYFGLHKDPTRWVFREYAPNATNVYIIIGKKNNSNEWKPYKRMALTPVGNGDWEIYIDFSDLQEGDLYRLKIYWRDGSGERLPAWCTRVVQDPKTYEFNAQAWISTYQWKNTSPTSSQIPLIYEAHIGMATEEYRVGTFKEFQDNIIPYIKKAGYNTIQLMAIQEHPYYASFGYQVSNFFAVSSRFGTPDDLKRLIDKAHEQGLKVIMDIVHSHAVKNELEGLNSFDGDPGLYFYNDARRLHPQWGTLCFNYEKGNVLHFLLSNCKYWLEEYHLDGFRFDGVSSMIYNNHALGITFSDYSMYFDNKNLNYGAITYLNMANELIHEINPSAITIAEEMSGFPGLATPPIDGGIGFDYRLSMGVPDYWIKTLKKSNIGDWNTNEMFHELTQKRADEKTISYAESHDQAMVGDQTISFRLLKDKIYNTMLRENKDPYTLRGIALHKMIRLVTIATAGNGYLNFMGNEFGHPEWIDFPRTGNNWSYQYARRQWTLNTPKFKFYELGVFDKYMIKTIKRDKLFFESPMEVLNLSPILVFQRHKYCFFFNFNNSQHTLLIKNYEFITKKAISYLEFGTDFQSKSPKNILLSHNEIIFPPISCLIIEIM